MKKILTYIFIGFFILTASCGVMFPQVAHAQGIPVGATLGAQLLGAAAKTGLGLATGGVSDLFANIVTINFIMGWIGKWVLHIMSVALWLTGILFDYSLSLTLHLSLLIANVPAINLAWQTIRDFASMFFIFLILYQAISMILGLSGLGTKQLLVNIFIAGLLINFSLFFTKVIIDASNIVALQFYNALTPDQSAADKGLSQVFMQNLGIQTVYDHTTNNPVTVNGLTSTIKDDNIILVTIMGSIIMLVAAFVFFAAACLFAIRVIVLVILLALSPIAYIGGVLPGTKEYASRWWSTLNKHVIFAPVYMIVIYIGLEIVGSQAFKTAVNGNATPNQTGQTFAGAFTALGSSSVTVVLNYVIVIIFMVAGLIIADKMGIEGAGTMNKWGKSLRQWGQGFVGRNTIGRASKLAGELYDKTEAKLKQDPGFSKFATIANTATLGLAGNINRGVRAGIQSGQNAKFGSSMNLEGKDKEIKEHNKIISAEQRTLTRNAAIAAASHSAATKDHIKTVQKEVTKMSGKEIEKLKMDKLTNPMVAAHLNASQMDSLMKSEEFNDAQKAEIRKAREEGLHGDEDGNGGLINNSIIGATEEERAKFILTNRKPEEIAKLPANFLKRPSVSESLTGNVLQKIARDGTLSDADRATIKSNITARGATPDPTAVAWLGSPAGSIF